jgi:hypothetical protein
MKVFYFVHFVKIVFKTVSKAAGWQSGRMAGDINRCCGHIVFVAAAGRQRDVYWRVSPVFWKARFIWKPAREDEDMPSGEVCAAGAFVYPDLQEERTGEHCEEELGFVEAQN